MKTRPTLLTLTLILALTACTQPTAAPSATLPPTPTDRATITPTLPPPTETATPSPTATATASPTPTLTPTATFTPRPQHPPLITFTMEQNGVPSIYAIAPDGSGLTLLAADVSLYNYNGPIWSPDGQNIAYLSGASMDTGRLNILNYETGETRQLDFDRVSYFTWSPDGQQIAFTTFLPEGDALSYPISLVSLSDFGLNTLFDMPTTKPISSLDWSPQGQSILARWHYIRNFVTYLCLISLSGEFVVVDNRGMDVHDASWTPSGEQIVFTGNQLEEEKYQTWLVSADGTQGQLIIEDTYIKSIDWSPDGSMLVYSNRIGWFEGVSYEDRLSGVYVYFLDTGTTIEVVPPEDFAYLPSFSPDSAFLVYLTATQDVENTGYALNVYSFATGTTTQIVPAYVARRQPTWRP